MGKEGSPTNSVFCLLLSYSAPATSISTKGHTMPRPFFGRCRAPSTCKADKDGPGLSFLLLPSPHYAAKAVRPLLGPQDTVFKSLGITADSKLSFEGILALTKIFM